MSDQWLMVFICIALVTWGIFSIRQYLQTTHSMENVYISDQYPQDEQVSTLLEQAGYTIVGGKYQLPLHIYLNEKQLEPTKIWIDMIVQREEQWYIVRIVRERMQLKWNPSFIRQQWSPYFAAYPNFAGLLVVDKGEQQIYLLQMEFRTNNS